jgi:hypothetical protein
MRSQSENVATLRGLLMSRWRHAGFSACIIGTLICAARVRAAGPQFNRDVRPILSENCYACHGPDRNQRKAKLRLDVREIALERQAIVPGKTNESKLVQHIFSTDPEEVMPPPASHKTLTASQKETLRAWIAAGAEYEPHWAYIVPKRPEPPAVSNRAWVNNPIDAFILHGLDEHHIQPSAEAAKRTLLRRLSLDLIGLPPTPAELEAFLVDQSPSAYERQVDRLLASPHYGERMAAPWLDLVRYADTVGYHGDQNQNVFPYRDYVINSFNRNKPFDQFTIEQLAGDLLPDPSIDAYVATCFNRLNMMTREGGAQPKEYLAKYAADRVRTVAMTWMGSTIGCAECHDHKFDPFATKDFYQMEAFFADLKQWGVYAEYDYTPNPDLRGVGNDHPFFPEIEVDSPYLRQRIARLQARQHELCVKAATDRAGSKAHQSEFEAWRKCSLSFLERWPDGWAAIPPAIEPVGKSATTNLNLANFLTNFTVQADGSVVINEKFNGSFSMNFSLPEGDVSALRLEVVPRPGAETKNARGKKLPGATVTLTASLKRHGSADQKLAFYFADASAKEERYASSSPILGVKEMWKTSTHHDRQTAVWLLDKPLAAKAGDILTVNLGSPALASVRLTTSPFPADDPLKSGLGEILRLALQKRTPTTESDRDLVERTFLLASQWDKDALARERKIEDEIHQCRNGRAFSQVAVAREPSVTRVLARGNWQDDSGEIVQPAVPHFLAQPANPEGRRLTRLDLARWLVSPDNPLTARTVMNRLWKQFFGTGISAVVDDLGAQGEWPVNPELLDWLACEFQNPQTEGTPSTATGAAGRSGPAHWDVKHMVKLIVMSSTYRQDSNQRPDLKDLDPNNRLFACQTPRRLEAEFVRDNALAIAGLLNTDIGGPSARPYQPAGYYANIQFPDRDYIPDTDDRQYRRGIYSHWQRTFLHPMLANFDAPAREECIAARIVSNTPQQALTLLDDPTFTEAARVFATSLSSNAATTDEQKLDAAFLRAVARPAAARERKSLEEFLALQRQHYRTNSDGALKLENVGRAPAPPPDRQVESAAWTQVCRVILNLHETITRE